MCGIGYAKEGFQDIAQSGCHVALFASIAGVDIVLNQGMALVVFSDAILVNVPCVDG